MYRSNLYYKIKVLFHHATVDNECTEGEGWANLIFVGRVEGNFYKFRVVGSHLHDVANTQFSALQKSSFTSISCTFSTTQYIIPHHKLNINSNFRHSVTWKIQIRINQTGNKKRKNPELFFLQIDKVRLMQGTQVSINYAKFLGLHS